MKIRAKSRNISGRARDLGQEEAKIEKTQAELEQVSKEQLSHMAGGKAAKAAAKQKTKIEKA